MSQSILTVSPCTPMERRQGWDECCEFENLRWSAGWTLSPQPDAYSYGAVSIDVIPVYWRQGGEAGVDWWVLEKTFVPADLAVLGGSPNSWKQVQSLLDIEKICRHWDVAPQCRLGLETKLSSMSEAERGWILHCQNIAANDPLSPEYVVVVPSAHIWSDWGIHQYDPAVLVDDTAEKYDRLRRDDATSLKKRKFGQ